MNFIEWISYDGKKLVRFETQTSALSIRPQSQSYWLENIWGSDVNGNLRVRVRLSLDDPMPATFPSVESTLPLPPFPRWKVLAGIKTQIINSVALGPRQDWPGSFV